MISIELLLLILNIVATAVMAATAATQAVRNDFDALGAAVLGVITAVGGGTIRDLLIGRTPVFWLLDPIYLYTAVPVGLITFFLVKKMAVGTGKRRKLMDYLDAIGLALFTLVGTKIAHDHGIMPAFCVVLGCVTGVGGGVIRDVLCHITPPVLTKDIYATLSLAGGVLYFVLLTFWGEESAMIVSFLAIALARVIVVARTPV